MFCATGIVRAMTAVPWFAVMSEGVAASGAAVMQHGRQMEAGERGGVFENQLSGMT